MTQPILGFIIAERISASAFIDGMRAALSDALEYENLTTGLLESATASYGGPCTAEFSKGYRAYMSNYRGTECVS